VGSWGSIIKSFKSSIYYEFILHGFDFASWDWNFILKATMTATGSYLSMKLMSTQDGKVFGAIG